MQEALTFGERMQHAGTGTVIGVLTVFLILVILWVVLIILQKVFYRPATPKKAAEPTAVPAAVQEASAKTDDTQLIAVLTAAVAAMLDAQNISTSFKIKSFRRTKSE